MLNNYAVPIDIILRELELNLSAQQFQLIGKSNVTEVKLNKLINAVDLEKSIEYSQNRINELITRLKGLNSVEDLSKIQRGTSTNKNIVGLSFLEKSIVDVLFENKKSIFYQFVKIINEQILNHHPSVLRNKVRYQNTQSKCRVSINTVS